MAGQRNSVTRMFVEREWRDREERAILDLARSVVVVLRWVGLARACARSWTERGEERAWFRARSAFARAGRRARRWCGWRRAVESRATGCWGRSEEPASVDEKGTRIERSNGRYNDIQWWAAKWILLGGRVGNVLGG